MGAVDHPGGFVLANDREQMSALKALALAGGFRRAAKPQQAVILRKDSATGHQKEVALDLKKVLDHKAEDVRLYPSDILFIPESGGKRAAYKMGEIALALGSGVPPLRLASYPPSPRACAANRLTCEPYSRRGLKAAWEADRRRPSRMTMRSPRRQAPTRSARPRSARFWGRSA